MKRPLLFMSVVALGMGRWHRERSKCVRSRRDGQLQG
jgi:hypothetical protein